MKKFIFIMMMGLFALLGNSFAQIKLWNNGGIAIGDTTDPGSEKTVFYDDVEFTGDVTGISNINAENTVNVDKKTFNIASTGWWQVAETNGGDHGMAIINVMDYTSSTHSSAKYLVTFQHGQGEIIQLIGDTYSTHGIIGVRLMYNTSDRVYGGARFEINVNRTGNFYISIEDYNTTYSYSEWVLLSNAVQEVGWTPLKQLGDPANYSFATGGKVNLGNSQTGDVLTIGTSNTMNSEGGLLIQAAAAGSNYFRYNRMSSWAGKTLIGNNASTSSDSPTTAIEIDGTSGSNVINVLGDLNVSATKDVTLPDDSELRFGDATYGMKMYSDGTYLRFNKGSATSALPFLLEQPISYIYSDNLYLGWTSGDNIHFRGNTVTATNWGITSAGNATFNSLSTSSSSTLSGLNVNGSSTLDAVTADGTGRFNAGLTVYQYLTIYGTFNNMSDVTLKTDINQLDVNSLEKIIQLQGVTYKFINDEEKKTVTGFIAQDVQKVFPELVSELDEGLAIKTLEIIPHLVEAIKEQQGIIEEQRGIIEDLDARLKVLEGK